MSRAGYYQQLNKLIGRIFPWGGKRLLIENVLFKPRFSLQLKFLSEADKHQNAKFRPRFLLVKVISVKRAAM